MYSGGGASAATAISVSASSIRSNFFFRHKQSGFVCEFTGFRGLKKCRCEKETVVLNKFTFTGCSVYMVIRRDAVRFWKCSGCDAHVIHIRDGGDNGVGVCIESDFCQLADGGEVACCEVVMATCINTEDKNFSSFHALCVAPLSGILPY